MRTKNVIESFRFALAGLLYVLRTQRNARLQVLIAAAVVAAGLLLSLSAMDWAILSLTLGLVIAAEAANTAVEAVVDLVSPEFHPLGKVAKDASAAAVLVLAVTSIAVGLLILGPPLLSVLRSSLAG
ncbi:MAG: diacylglycerol kinase family protein [Planctomycetaceae bacterium]